ncbi:FecR domain-containing protein [Devosia sp. XJ19-1]|uniref:FecR domain-containing protein n=1 Tax=Devosia ureilytica TaxID=2952754 RepID=A0A9Q4FRA4_9HYPH|nr:FecR domain-containing protein [Devosia ureilytica]MCP8882086.1 FecR domain-containing protein [Devosia ureilytica]MCP8886028.1 FecR domain-containing protein [Devosia ureilytica]
MIKHIACTAIASLFLLTSAFAAGEGTAVGVKPDAVSRLGSADRILVVGADVSVGEKIVTGPSGNVQLLFDDRTRLVVGPRSTLEIETYLLNGTGADKFAVNALAGTFRFISGTSPKSVYSIDTPTASIAVRGTKFDLTVGGGQTLTLLYEGALTQCQGGTCVDLTKRCDIAATGGGNGNIFGWTDGRHGGLAGNFPLPNIQSAFGRDFRIGGAQACLNPPAATTNTSIANPSAPSSQSQSQTQTSYCSTAPINAPNC